MQPGLLKYTIAIDMQVLLISPKDPLVPKNLHNLLGGENTYTQMLLDFPPVNIRFDYFEDALVKRDITYHPLQNFFLYLQKLRILPLGPRVQMLVLRKKYDLVYAHAHPVKLFGLRAPLLISDSSSNRVFLDKYLKWPAWRIRLTTRLQSWLFVFFNIITGEINSDKAEGFFVFSVWAQKIKNLEYRIKNCQVIYPGLPIPRVGQRHTRKRNSKQIKLLFVGVWFERKGGRILLNAYRKLRLKYPQVTLTILGELPFDVSIYRSEGVIHKNHVSYQDLLSFYRTHDILVHVPPEIEGYGMTVPEAMSYGMVPVVSDICVLPEFVEHEKSGLIVKAGSVIELEKALTRLIRNETLRRNLSLGARKRFVARFSLPVFHKKLTAYFFEAINHY